MPKQPSSITSRARQAPQTLVPAQRLTHRQPKPGSPDNPWVLVVYPKAFEAICADLKTVEPRAGFPWLARLQVGEHIEFRLHLDPSAVHVQSRQRVVVRVTEARRYSTLHDLCDGESLSSMKPGFENDPIKAWKDLRWGITPEAEKVALVAIEFERISAPEVIGAAATVHSKSA